MQTTRTTEPEDIAATTKAMQKLSGQRRGTLSVEHVREFTGVLLAEADVHAKRIESLANQ